MEETTLSGRLPVEVIVTKSRSFSTTRKKQVAEFVSYLFILLFTYASIRVLSDYEMFIREIYSLSVFEPVKWGLAVICIAELFAAVCLMIPKTRLAGLVQTFGIMIVINIASLIVLQRAPIMPPIFGGIFPGVDFFGHFYINLAFLFVALIGILCQVDSKRI